MTDKQTERVKAKIEKYKKALVADKKYWGGQYHDGQGIRYIIPEQFIKIQDYKGAIRYFNWFHKNFPGDSGDTVFLFEWTFILFKCNSLIEAEKKAQQTFFSNIYLFDKFLGKEPMKLNTKESSNWEFESLENSFPYSSLNTEFFEFSNWINKILNTQTFREKATAFINLERKLIDEPAGQKRTELINKIERIKYS